MAQEIRRNVGGPTPKNTQYIFAHLREAGVEEMEGKKREGSLKWMGR